MVRTKRSCARAGPGAGLACHLTPGLARAAPPESAPTPGLGRTGRTRLSSPPQPRGWGGQPAPPPSAPGCYPGARPGSPAQTRGIPRGPPGPAPVSVAWSRPLQPRGWRGLPGPTPGQHPGLARGGECNGKIEKRRMAPAPTTNHNEILSIPCRRHPRKVVASPFRKHPEIREIRKSECSPPRAARVLQLRVPSLVFAGAPADRGGCRRHSRKCRRHSTASRREWRLHPASAPTPGQHPGLGRTRTPGCYPGGGAGRRRGRPGDPRESNQSWYVPSARVPGLDPGLGRAADPGLDGMLRLQGTRRRRWTPR